MSVSAGPPLPTRLESRGKSLPGKGFAGGRRERGRTSAGHFDGNHLEPLAQAIRLTNAKRRAGWSVENHADIVPNIILYYKQVVAPEVAQRTSSLSGCENSFSPGFSRGLGAAPRRYPG